MEHTILSWSDETHLQETPLLIVGKRLRDVKLFEAGMEIYGLHAGVRYRLESFGYENERDERNKVQRLVLIPLLSSGDGKPKVGSNVNSHLAVKTADIKGEHQELFYPDQKVSGRIVDGTLVPDEK